MQVILSSASESINVRNPTHQNEPTEESNPIDHSESIEESNPIN